MLVGVQPDRIKGKRSAAMSKIENSSEAQALQRHFDRLVLSIQDPAVVADRAFSRGLIPQAVHEEATDPAMGPRMKRNRILLRAVLSHVQEEPSGFKAFLGILRQERVYDSLAKKLESSLRSTKHVPQTSPRVSSSRLVSWEQVLLVIGIGLMVTCILLLITIFLNLVPMPSLKIYFDLRPPQTEYPVDTHIEPPNDNGKVVPESDLPVLNRDMPFVGRDRELAEISSYLQSATTYVIGIHGPPAFGKSTLAIHVGWEVLGRGISVRYVDIRERNLFQSSNRTTHNFDAKDTVTEVQKHEDHLQIRTEQSHYRSKHSDCQGTCDDLVKWAGRLSSKHVLILDNCDSILTREKREKFLHMIKVLLQQSSYQYLSIVLTSQTKVTFVDQKALTYHISELSDTASLALLQAIVSVKHNLTLEDGDRVATLVGKCPLALKVVAGTMRDYPGKSVVPVIQRLEQNVLKAISPRTLSISDQFEKVMDLAYSYLPPEVKKCVSYIHGFPGSFHEDAGTSILDSCGSNGQECLEILESRSLIERYWFGMEFRYQLHRLIREYFRLQPSSSLVDFDPIFQEYYTTMFINLYGQSQTDTSYITYRLTVELPNLERLLTICLSDLSNHVINDKGAVILVLGYINQHVHLQINDLLKKDFFGRISHYKQFICSIIGEAKYNVIYADLLKGLYETECRSQHKIEECRCAELCRSAIITLVWYTDAHQPSGLSASCFSCPIILVFHYCKHLISLFVDLCSSLLFWVHHSSMATLRLLYFVVDTLVHTPQLSSLYILIVLATWYFGLIRWYTCLNLICVILLAFAAFAAFDSWYSSFTHLNPLLSVIKQLEETAAKLDDLRRHIKSYRSP